MKPDEARAALKALDEQKPPYTVREVAKGTAAGAASKGGETKVRLPAWLSSRLGGKGDCMDVLHRQKGRACILIGAGAATYCNGTSQP